MNDTEPARTPEHLELCTFRLGDALCGVDILRVQEINRQLELTPVPQAPAYVRGVTNLRGRVITVVDLGAKLGLGEFQPGEHSRNVIVSSQGELIGVLVDEIADVVPADADAVEPPPANVGGEQGSCFSGVVKLDGTLINIVDVERALGDGE